MSALLVVSAVGCSSPGGGPSPASAIATERANELIALAGQVFETTDYNLARQLDHLALISPQRDAAFEGQTAALKQGRAGYFCAGMATYLSYVIAKQGYRNITYNSGSSPFTHVVTLVELGDDLYFADVYTGLIARRFDAVLSSLLAEDQPSFARLFEPMGRTLRKRYFTQLDPLLPWASASAEQVSSYLRSTFSQPTTVRQRNSDGSLDVEFESTTLPDFGNNLSECRVSAAGMLSCTKSPADYLKYEQLAAGIESRTGVRNGLFMMPLNLHSDEKHDLLSKFPYLQVLEQYTTQFQGADALDPPDMTRYRELARSLRQDLRNALQNAATH